MCPHHTICVCRDQIHWPCSMSAANSNFHLWSAVTRPRIASANYSGSEIGNSASIFCRGPNTLQENHLDPTLPNMRKRWKTRWLLCQTRGREGEQDSFYFIPAPASRLSNYLSILDPLDKEMVDGRWLKLHWTEHLTEKIARQGSKHFIP